MTCTPANEPQMIEVTDLIYAPADYERRFLTGWWTRGVIPADNFTATNWAGLIIPKSITFDNNEITIEYPGRWWGEESCPRSIPKVVIHIQYVCKGGRLYLHSDVHYGKKVERQTYAGHNGASKFSRISLEKIEGQCSLEQVADIPLSKADEIELKHLADWIVTMVSAPGVVSIGEPNIDWLTLFAEYTETDLQWAPCDGCIFPTQNYSIAPILSTDNMLQLEARLAVQTIKALGDILIFNTVPSAFNVPLCSHNTYLEVSLPDLVGVMHMRDFFNCDHNQYFTDEYRSIPVGGADLLKCFQIPEPDTWPSPENPKWVEECLPQYSQSCSLGVGWNNVNTGYTTVSAYQSYGGVNHTVCGEFFVVGKRPKPNGNLVTVVASSMKTTYYNMVTCYILQTYDGPVTVTGCTRIREQQQTILFQQETSNPGPLTQSIWEANGNGLSWTCNSSFNGPGAPPPPQPNIPPNGPPQGPNNNTGKCFLEGELVYALRLQTILGDLSYSLSIPVRAKVPQGTANLGPISGSISGTTLNISTQLGGNFTADLGSLFAGFNAVGNAISSVLPVSFGLRNVRVLCP